MATVAAPLPFHHSERGGITVYTLTRANRRLASAGEPLPPVFPALDIAGVKIRRGQLTLVAAAPGVGKSVFALKEALAIKLPTLVISADTDNFDTTHRASAMITGHRMNDIETAYADDKAQYYNEKIEAALSHIRFTFDGSPSLMDIDDEVMAFAMIYGEYPHLLVVDNLSNVVPGDNRAEGYQALEATLEFLHELGRRTGSAIVVLHHVTGEYDNGDIPVPLSGLRGKVSKIPERVLTLFRDPALENRLGVAIVKNRGGKASAAGQYRVYLEYVPERMRLE